MLVPTLIVRVGYAAAWAEVKAKQKPSKIVLEGPETPVQRPTRSFVPQLLSIAVFKALNTVAVTTKSLVPESTIAPPVL